MTCRARVFGVAVAVVVCALAAATSAAAANFTWTGAAPSGTPAWSNGTNWGGSAPSGTVGTLAFPKLTSAACTAASPTATCYVSNNDVTGLTANAITLDDGSGNNGIGYQITGNNPITLGTGGLTASTTSSPKLLSFFEVPLTLSAPQTWSIDDNGVELQGGAVNGGANALTIDTASQGELEVGADIEAGTITLGGTIALDGSRSAFSHGIAGQLNGTNGHAVSVNDTSLATASGGGNSGIGPFTTSSTSGHSSVVFIGDEGGIAGELTVDGGATLNSTSTLSLAYGGPGTTPGTDYSQLSASGPVDLGSANLQLYGSTPGASPACVSLNHGDVNTLVTTTGTLTGTFNGIPDGTVVPVACSPASGTAAMVRINYTANSVTATVVSGSSTPPPPPPTTTTTTTPPPPPPPPPPTSPSKRASATQVNCNLDLSTDIDTCGATVGDGGPQPAETPTGQVDFTSHGGGTLLGSVCDLAQTPFSPGVASCTIQYRPPGSGFPDITATYQGSGTFNPSAGTTALMGNGGTPPDENNCIDSCTQFEITSPQTLDPGQTETTVETSSDQSGTTADVAQEATDNAVEAATTALDKEATEATSQAGDHDDSDFASGEALNHQQADSLDPPLQDAADRLSTAPSGTDDDDAAAFEAGLDQSQDIARPAAAVSSAPTVAAVISSIAATHPSSADVRAFNRALTLATSPVYSPARAIARLELVDAVAIGGRVIAHDLGYKRLSQLRKSKLIVLDSVHKKLPKRKRIKLVLKASALGGRILRLFDVVGLSHKITIHLKVSETPKGKHRAHSVTKTIRVL